MRRRCLYPLLSIYKMSIWYFHCSSSVCVANQRNRATNIFMRCAHVQGIFKEVVMKHNKSKSVRSCCRFCRFIISNNMSVSVIRCSCSCAHLRFDRTTERKDRARILWKLNCVALPNQPWIVLSECRPATLASCWRCTGDIFIVKQPTKSILLSNLCRRFDYGRTTSSATTLLAAHSAHSNCSSLEHPMWHH